MKLIPYYKNLCIKYMHKMAKHILLIWMLNIFIFNMFLMFYHMGCENHNCKDNIYNAL